MAEIFSEGAVLNAPAVALSGVGRRDVSGGWRLREVNLTIQRGDCLHLIGPSGSGKTTLLRLLNRLDEADTGKINVLGRPVGQWPPGELRRRVALVQQEPVCMGATVREDLQLAWAAIDDVPADDDRLAEALKQVAGDPAWLDTPPDELSTGERHRVVIARSCLMKPEILLLDEPAAALDPATAHQVLEALDRERESTGRTLVIATHRVKEARRMGGPAVVLADGQPVGEGAIDALADDPPEAVADWLGDASDG